jgi:polynucleotide 5'-kinase involved in rRNA processing
VRCTQLTHTVIKGFEREVYDHIIQAHPEVVEDETTEQVFSRKDRKAYRAEVLKQRTEASRRVTKRKASTLGKEVQARGKARRAS